VPRYILPEAGESEWYIYKGDAAHVPEGQTWPAVLHILSRKTERIFLMSLTFAHRMTQNLGSPAQEIGSVSHPEYGNHGASNRMAHLSLQLKDELERQVQARTGRRVRNLCIELCPESVILRGQAKTYYVKQLAQHGIRDLLPQVRLENAIEVGELN
jgi:hypothetical protein